MSLNIINIDDETLLTTQHIETFMTVDDQTIDYVGPKPWGID